MSSAGLKESFYISRKLTSDDRRQTLVPLLSLLQNDERGQIEQII
jgi:hypothetical protein